jgi:hypothetical protein
MCYRFSALVVALVMVAGSLADDTKDKKDAKDGKAEATKVKGHAAKFNKDKKIICLKVGDSEKEYTLADEFLLITPGNQKIKISLKDSEGDQASQGSKGGIQAIQYAVKDKQELELVLGEKDVVKEVHWNPKASAKSKTPPTPPPPPTSPVKSGDKKDDKK